MHHHLEYMALGLHTRTYSFICVWCPAVFVRVIHGIIVSITMISEAQHKTSHTCYGFVISNESRNQAYSDFSMPVE